jgi:hypothetical protein
MSATDQTDVSKSPTVRLVSKPSGWFADVLVSDMKISTYIETALAANPDRTVLVIDLSQAALERICRYCQLHRGIEPALIEPPLRSRRLHEVCSDIRDADFVEEIANASQSLLFEVAVGALYLQIQSLVHLTCARLAAAIKSHPLDKVKYILLNGLRQPVQPPPALIIRHSDDE